MLCDIMYRMYFKLKGNDFMEAGKKNLVVSIDEELHQRLKIHCVEQKTSLKEMIVKLISKELEEAERAKERKE